MYDKDNLFAKIIRGEISAKKVYEDAQVLAIHDINPVAPIHVLVMPKGEYVDFNHFVTNATTTEVQNYFATIAAIGEKLGLNDSGYRLVSNLGAHSGQTIFHFHTHIISGKKLKGLVG